MMVDLLVVKSPLTPLKRMLFIIPLGLETHTGKVSTLHNNARNKQPRCKSPKVSSHGHVSCLPSLFYHCRTLQRAPSLASVELWSERLLLIQVIRSLTTSSRVTVNPHQYTSLNVSLKMRLIFFVPLSDFDFVWLDIENMSTLWNVTICI